MPLASPYLLSLGITKSNVAMVFIAGPLSGLLMQPLIGVVLDSTGGRTANVHDLGVLADKSTSRFGRRRPYMLFGCILCMTGMLLLGYTRPFASIFTGQDNASVSLIIIYIA